MFGSPGIWVRDLGLSDAYYDGAWCCSGCCCLGSSIAVVVTAALLLLLLLLLMLLLLLVGGSSLVGAHGCFFFIVRCGARVVRGLTSREVVPIIV